MNVALIGDIHANLPALEAVLEDARRKGAEQIWNIGDFVGYNAFPEECVRLIRQRGDIHSIIGNYDQKVLKAEEKRKKWSESKDPLKAMSFVWSYDQLSEDSREYLRSLPVERFFYQPNWRILLTHGSPASNEEHLSPDTPEDRLRELADLTPANLIICGHSHRAFSRRVDHKLFINTGSVGRPDDGDPRAAYALLALEVDELEVTHYRVDYDVERAARAILERGLPEDFAQMIREGRSLDGVKQRQGT